MIQQVPQQSSDLGDMPTPTRGDDGNVLTYDRQLGVYVLKPPPKAERRGGMLSYIAGNPGPTRLRDLDDVSGTPSGATDGYAYLYDSALDAFVLGEVSTSSTIAGATDFGGTPGPGTDGYAVTWDNGAGEFVLTEMSGGITDHGALTGLADDDHAQYLLATGARAGATDQTQAFTNGIITNIVRPPNDITPVRFQNTAGTIDIFSVDVNSSNVDFVGNLRMVNDLGLTAKDTGGTNRTMFRLTNLNHINIGTTGGTNRMYLQCGSDIYFRPSSIAGRWTANGRLSVGQNANGTAFLDVAGSTTSEASLRLRSGSAPSSPNDGDIWYATSGRAHLYRGSTDEIFATGEQQTGGSATAGASYTSNEQDMLQAVYDAAREFGLLD